MSLRAEFVKYLHPLDFAYEGAEGEETFFVSLRYRYRKEAFGDAVI